MRLGILPFWALIFNSRIIKGSGLQPPASYASVQSVLTRSKVTSSFVFADIKQDWSIWSQRWEDTGHNRRDHQAVLWPHPLTRWPDDGIPFPPSAPSWTSSRQCSHHHILCLPKRSSVITLVFNGPYYDIVMYSLFIFVVISLVKNRNIKNTTLYNFQT